MKTFIDEVKKAAQEIEENKNTYLVNTRVYSGTEIKLKEIVFNGKTNLGLYINVNDGIYYQYNAKTGSFICLGFGINLENILTEEVK